MGVTDDRNDPGLQNIGPDGMQEKYLVLSEDERARGFVRPLRYSYKHIGPPAPKHPLRDLTPEEQERYADYGYVKYEEYPKDPESSVVGTFWTQRRLDGGCGHITTMGSAIAETYASDPAFYGGTFCSHCGKHFPVGEKGEFIWIDPITGQDSNERVGT
jgi:hypothetical protein